MIDYSFLKSLAFRSGLSSKDLLALSPQNDPFYVGARKQRQKGEWFAAIYLAMGSPPRCHIRRVHYWLVTTNAVPKPNGKPYQNTQNDWGLLTLAAKYARYLGLVPIENIIDRRNPEPIIHAEHWNHLKPSDVRDSIDEASIIESIVSQFWCFNPSKTQPYMVECWAEKSTMNDVLVPVCEEYGLNLVTGLGELSITAVYLLAKRIVECQKPVRIFYISDFDPAGESMPLAVSRKIEYFARNYAELAQSDIKLIPLMLTAEQCQTYNLPRTPIKDTEKRKDKFEERHGVGATELDAMEALHPGTMREIIVSAVEPFFDRSAWNMAIKKNREIQASVREYLLGRTCEECTGGLVSREERCLGCNGLGYNKTEDPCKTCSGRKTVTNEYDCDTCNGTGQIPGKIGQDVLGDLETAPFDSYIPPGSSSSDDTDTNDWLYNSSLEYISQIDRYRLHKAQDSSGITDDDTVNPFED